MNFDMEKARKRLEDMRAEQKMLADQERYAERHLVTQPFAHLTHLLRQAGDKYGNQHLTIHVS